MKSTELMLGDWTNTPRGIGRVEMIQDNETVFTTAAEGIDGAFDVNKITPIPLSGEILRVNDFLPFKDDEIEEVKGWLYKNRDEEIVIIPEWQPDNLTLCLYKKGQQYAEIPNINNVHQLQHALRLIGYGELADTFKIKE